MTDMKPLLPTTIPVRVFLVVVDETPELRAALRYACLRATHTGGRVALLNVIEPEEVQHFLAVDTLIRAERREAAEARMAELAEEVTRLTGTIPIIVIREGRRRDELMRLIAEDPAISILVLAAGAGPDGPGPLVTYLTGRGVTKLRIPVTIVPGTLSDEELIAIA